jgi:hypothetical protein
MDPPDPVAWGLRAVVPASQRQPQLPQPQQLQLLALKNIALQELCAQRGIKARPTELQALEQLVLLIAQQVGVPPAAIERVLPPAAPEP